MADNTLQAQILNHPSYKEVRWHVCRECLKLIIFPSYEYKSIDALETDIKAFCSTLVSPNKKGEVNRPQKALKHFPDLSNLIAEKCQLRR